MKLARPFLFLLLALAVGSIALSVRLRAVDRLPLDYDEPVYLGIAQRYAEWLNQGDIRAIVDYDFNYEHPPLSKLAYALAIQHLPSAPILPEIDSTKPRNLEQKSAMPQPQFDTARRVGAVFASVAGVRARVAGSDCRPAPRDFDMADQIYQPDHARAAAGPAEHRHGRGLRGLAAAESGARRDADRWLPLALLALSAVAFGLTEASKFTYGVAGVAILADWLWRTRPDKPAGKGEALRSTLRWLMPALLWILLAVIAFVASNPRMWDDPLSPAQGVGAVSRRVHAERQRPVREFPHVAAVRVALPGRAVASGRLLRQSRFRHHAPGRARVPLALAAPASHGAVARHRAGVPA